MDPRPYNYEFRRPRISNPTLYSLSYLANQVDFTIASIIREHTETCSETYKKSTISHFTSLQPIVRTSQRSSIMMNRSIRKSARLILELKNCTDKTVFETQVLSTLAINRMLDSPIMPLITSGAN